MAAEEVRSDVRAVNDESNKQSWGCMCLSVYTLLTAVVCALLLLEPSVIVVCLAIGQLYVQPLTTI